MSRWKWLIYYIRWFLIRCYHVLFGKYLLSGTQFGKNPLHSAQEGNDEIARKIIQKEPFAFCRFSFVEMDIMVKCQTEKYWKIATYKRNKELVDMFRMVGEPKYKGIQRFASIMEKATEDADIIGIWRPMLMADAYLEHIKRNAEPYVSHADCVQSYTRVKPWTKELEGKKVLVVSPFSEEVKSQYQRRELLWENKDILPEFELDTLDSVWYFAGCKDERFSNWFEALDYLYKEIMKKDFDIVLLGCGPFGFPLATMVKNAGKQAIHMGGAVQILFGIKGKRWDDSSVGGYYNEYWIRPGEKTKPKDAEKLDKECYW